MQGFRGSEAQKNVGRFHEVFGFRENLLPFAKGSARLRDLESGMVVSVDHLTRQRSSLCCKKQITQHNHLLFNGSPGNRLEQIADVLWRTLGLFGVVRYNNANTLRRAQTSSIGFHTSWGHSESLRFLASHVQTVQTGARV